MVMNTPSGINTGFFSYAMTVTAKVKSKMPVSTQHLATQSYNTRKQRKTQALSLNTAAFTSAASLVLLSFTSEMSGDDSTLKLQ